MREDGAPLTCLFCLALLGAAAPAAAEEFRLAIPGQPQLAATARQDESELVITDTAGRSHNYLRQRELDSGDSRWLGYHSAEEKRALRWPASGIGPLQTANATGAVAPVRWFLSRAIVLRGGEDADSTLPLGAAEMHVAALDSGAGGQVVARFDEQGELRFYTNSGKRWTESPADVDDPPFVPGAPLRLLPDPENDLPVVYSMNKEGEFFAIKSDRIRKLSGLKTRFAPGSDFELFADQRVKCLFAVDVQGRIWQLDAAGARHQLVESRPGKYEPGIPLRAAGAGGQFVFLVDRCGNLVSYRRVSETEWLGPEILGEGFPPGAPLATWESPDAVGSTLDINLALVDNAGRLHVLRHGPKRWERDMVQPLQFAPGARLAALESNGMLSVVLATPDGRLLEMVNVGSMWVERPIGDGFPACGGACLSRRGPSAFAFDQADRLIACTRREGAWKCQLCGVPGPVQPELSGPRKLLPSQEPSSIDIELYNSAREELTVRLVDRRAPDRAQQFAIRPGATAKARAERDPGRILEEGIRLAVPGGQAHEVARQIMLPPQSWYDVTVLAKRTAYEYIDRRKDVTPPLGVQKPLVSLGRFPLPAGEWLPPGSVIDVAREAAGSHDPRSLDLWETPARP